MNTPAVMLCGAIALTVIFGSVIELGQTLHRADPCAGYEGRKNNTCYYRSQVDPTIIYEVDVSIAQPKLPQIQRVDAALRDAMNAALRASAPVQND